MAVLGLVRACRGVVRRTTIADPAAERARDLALRNFRPLTPDRLWIADITHVMVPIGINISTSVCSRPSAPDQAGPRRTVEQDEFASAKWVNWMNRHRHYE